MCCPEKRYLDAVDEFALDEWIDSDTGNMAWKGVRPKNATLTPSEIKRIIDENASLIRSLYGRDVIRLQKRLYGLVRGRYAKKDIEEWLSDRCDLTESQARLLVDDQVAKLTERMKLAKWRKMGIGFVMWKHMGTPDPRDYHKRTWDGKSGIWDSHPNGLDGFVFQIDNPPVIDEKTMTKGYPGQLIGCRCRLVAIKGL